MAQPALKPALSLLDAAPTVPALAGVAVRFAAALTKWGQRHSTRNELRHLSDFQLYDIGIDREAARAEIEKRFWQG